MMAGKIPGACYILLQRKLKSLKHHAEIYCMSIVYFQTLYDTDSRKKRERMKNTVSLYNRKKGGQRNMGGWKRKEEQEVLTGVEKTKK